MIPEEKIKKGLGSVISSAVQKAKEKAEAEPAPAPAPKPKPATSEPEGVEAASEPAAVAFAPTPTSKTRDRDASRGITGQQADTAALLTGGEEEDSPLALSGAGTQEQTSILFSSAPAALDEPDTAGDVEETSAVDEADGAAEAEEDKSEFRQSAETLNEYYDVFDNPNNPSDGDDNASTNDFERLAEGNYNQDEVRSYLEDERGLSAEEAEAALEDIEGAAQFFVDNPTYFSAADAVDDGEVNEGEVNGKIRRYNAEALVEFAEQHDQALATHGDVTEISNPGQAATILEDFFPLADTAAGEGGSDLEASRDDLRALVANGDTPEPLRLAAQYFLDSDLAFEAVERSDNADSGGALKLSEVQATANQYRDLDPEVRSILEEHRLGEDGFIQVGEDGSVTWRDSGDPVSDDELTAIRDAIGNEPVEQGLLGTLFKNDLRSISELAQPQVEALEELAGDISPIYNDINQENANFARYLQENADLLSQQELDELTAEHDRRIAEHQARLEEEAARLVDQAEDPEFQEMFESLPQEKQEMFFDTLEMVAETDAADDFIGEFIEDFANENPENPYAASAGRLVSTGYGTNKVRQGVTALTTSRLLRDLDRGGNVDEALDALRRAAGGNVPQDVLDGFRDLANAGTGSEIRQARSRLATAINGVADGTTVNSVFDVFAPAAAALDLYRLADGETSVSDPEALLSLAGNTTDTAAIILNRAGKLSRVAGLAGRANVVASAGLSLVGLAGDIGDGDVAGIIGNGLSAVGAGLTLTAGWTGVGAVAGGVLIGLGTAINLANDFGLFERDQYLDYERGLNDVIGLNDNVQGIWTGLPQEFQDELKAVAEERGLTTREAFSIYYTNSTDIYSTGGAFQDTGTIDDVLDVSLNPNTILRFVDTSTSRGYELEQQLIEYAESQGISPDEAFQQLGADARQDYLAQVVDDPTSINQLGDYVAENLEELIASASEN